MSFDLSDLTFGLSDLTLNAAGLLSTRERFRRLAGEHADLMDSLTPEVRKRVEVLTEIQGQHDELKANFVKEKDALEAKYQKLYEPLYTKRYEIVNALVEVEDVIKETGDETPVEGTTGKEKGVPGFWLAAMKANQELEEEIQERDEEALKFLKDIKWYRIDDPRGFKLEFFFDLNPYFKNSVLTKTYHVAEENDEVTLEKAIGTEIDWFAGKCLTQKIVKKKAKMGMMNVIRPTTKTVNCKSFFNFFNPPPIPTDEEDTNEEMQNQCEADYEMGSIIRDEIIPHAVLWFIQEVARARRSVSKSSSDSELVIV